MIPTIEDILRMLQNEECSLAQANQWIEQHLEMAADGQEEKEQRNDIAIVAMNGLLSNCEPMDVISSNFRLEIVAASYQIADAMILESNK